MKKAFLSTALFFKRPSIIGRLILIIFPLFILSKLIVPDMLFHFSMSSPKEFSIEELSAMPKEDIPRYIKVKDAQVLRSSVGLSDFLKNSDSAVVESFSNSIKAEAYQYVLSQRIKKGDTSIAYVIYPVYSTKAIEENPGKNAGELIASVVVKDSKYTQHHEDNNNYFTDAKFTIEGQHDTDQTESAEIAELKNSGFLISDNVVVLDKGQTVMGWGGLTILGLLGVFFVTFSVLSFFPENTLRNFFEELPEIKEIK